MDHWQNLENPALQCSDAVLFFPYGNQALDVVFLLCLLLFITFIFLPHQVLEAPLTPFSLSPAIVLVSVPSVIQHGHWGNIALMICCLTAQRSLHHRRSGSIDKVQPPRREY